MCSSKRSLRPKYRRALEAAELRAVREPAQMDQVARANATRSFQIPSRRALQASSPTCVLPTDTTGYDIAASPSLGLPDLNLPDLGLPTLGTATVAGLGSVSCDVAAGYGGTASASCDTGGGGGDTCGHASATGTERLSARMADWLLARRKP